MDHDRDGKLTREQFISGILNTSKLFILATVLFDYHLILNCVISGFPTERWEMDIVTSLFVRDGLIDYKEFVNALKDKPVTFISINP